MQIWLQVYASIARNAACAQTHGKQTSAFCSLPHTRLQGNELWVFLIEKAFAKYVGGYAYLDGGRSPWAWHVLTGDNVFSYKLAQPLKDQWERHIYKFEEATSKKDQRHKYAACANFASPLMQPSQRQRGRATTQTHTHTHTFCPSRCFSPPPKKNRCCCSYN